MAVIGREKVKMIVVKIFVILINAKDHFLADFCLSQILSPCIELGSYVRVDNVREKNKWHPSR